MANVINNCIKNAISTDIAKIFYINYTDKFIDVIKESKHKYYINDRNFELLSLDGVYMHSNDTKIQYDLIICDDIPNDFKHVITMCDRLQLPFIHLLHSSPNIKMESFYLFIRDAEHHTKIFLDNDVFERSMSPKTNAIIGLQDWDQIMTDTCNEVYIKWK